jgi:hypothetical protein
VPSGSGKQPKELWSVREQVFERVGVELAIERVFCTLERDAQAARALDRAGHAVLAHAFHRPALLLEQTYDLAEANVSRGAGELDAAADPASRPEKTVTGEGFRGLRHVIDRDPKRHRDRR